MGNNLPLALQICILIFWLFAVPFAAGNCLGGVTGNGDREGRAVFAWVSGQMLLWGIFQLICVPFVLFEGNFCHVVYLFGITGVVLTLCGVVRYGIRRIRESVQLLSVPDGTDGKEKMRKLRYLPWVVFGLLLLLQLVQAVRLAYGDGDDAYYVAVSAITENAETMYRKLPYTGGTTQVDIRHGLAPFPIWIAFLARVSGIKAVTVAHVAVPLALIPMTYGIFYLLGGKLFANKRRFLPLFLILTELLVIFGDYSFYTAERFMLARSRQGKAALGSIVLPMLLFLMLFLLERMQEKHKCGMGYWVLLCSVMLAGCLCSTMGAFLLCLFIAVTGLCGAICFRRWKVLMPLVLCCLPCVCYALLYVLN